MLNALMNHKLILSVGTGGVGKTTLSASLAVAMAEAGKKVLVITIDPSKRLKTALGLEDLSTAVTRVGLSAKGELYASLLDPKKIFDQFIQNNASEDLYKKILKNKLYQNISSLLAGSQEFTSLEFVLDAYESKKYDVIILDTPPAQHAIDFLRAPQRFYHLFDEKVISWFQSDKKEEGFFAKMIFSGTKKATGVLERLVGKSFLSEIYEFFSLLGSLSEKIRNRSVEAQNLLSSTETAFCLVSSFDPIKIIEAKDLYRLLKREGYALKAVVMNRAFPFIDEPHDLPTDLQAIYSDLAERFKEQKNLQATMLSEIGGDVTYIAIPEQNFEISSLEALRTLSQSIFI